jgi:ABC-type transporter Mla maintaining outer membrane lipid asymmetry ATPase subunit MlaF
MAVIDQGRILTIGSPAEVRNRPDPLIQKFLQADLKHL